MLLIACILSGCDYLDSVKGVGFKRAVKLVNDAGPDSTLLDALAVLKEDSKLKMPKKYERKFDKAILTFKFQRVFCPTR
jgi:exonuclease 1